MKAPAVFASAWSRSAFSSMGPVAIAVDSYGPVTNPDRMLSDAPPSRDDVTTSRT